METVDKVRMVYNATKSDLNDSVYVPSFSIPTVDIYLRSVKAGTYMSDCDVDEISSISCRNLLLAVMLELT